VRRVHVEKAAAIGTQLLDGDLRRHRADRDALFIGDHLFGHRLVFVIHQRLPVGTEFWLLICKGFHERCGMVSRKGLHHALAA
jgi:hypothetical protein